ncbi:MAG: hypothetical protein GVX96_00865 [Bacteroidetes bacterium]|jgi:hypothetical protein|nr:hypothetical protein [Bacteroidota bacterium]
MNNHVFVLVLGLISLISITSCGEDESMMPDMDEMECEENITFSSDVERIINTNCAYSGCHVSGTGLPDYTSYDGVAAQVENGRFENRVLIQQNMPPSNASGPTTLSEDDLFTLECWIEQGFPE